MGYIHSVAISGQHIFGVYGISFLHWIIRGMYFIIFQTGCFLISFFRLHSLLVCIMFLDLGVSIQSEGPSRIVLIIMVYRSSR